MSVDAHTQSGSRKCPRHLGDVDLFAAQSSDDCQIRTSDTLSYTAIRARFMFSAKAFLPGYYPVERVGHPIADTHACIGIAQDAESSARML